MNAKQDYPYVWKWGAYMGSYGYYIKQQVRQARADKAPSNDGSWATTDDITIIGTGSGCAGSIAGANPSNERPPLPKRKEASHD